MNEQEKDFLYKNDALKQNDWHIGYEFKEWGDILLLVLNAQS